MFVNEMNLDQATLDVMPADEVDVISVNEMIVD